MATDFQIPDSEWLVKNSAADAFPMEITQWSDEDEDGYGDNKDGYLPDECPSVYGLSNENKIYGCVDSDGDGYADTDDFCPDGPEECLEAMLKGRAPPINILINLGFIVIVLFIGVGIWKHNRINRGN